MSDAAFNGKVAEKFAVYADHTRGYVRYQLIRLNLEPYLNGKKLKIADVGGGSGVDAVWLAELGHHVEIIEPAADQLDLAQKRASVLKLNRNITLHQATAGDVLGEGGRGKYDMVLSHGVVMYLDDPGERVKELVQLARPGGYISLLEKGFAASQQRLIQAKRWHELVELTRTGQTVNNIGFRVHAFTPQQLRRMLAEAGARTRSWGGVRVLSDLLDMPTGSLKKSELQLLLDAELENYRQPGTKGMGQMLHFIAQKSA